MRIGTVDPPGQRLQILVHADMPPALHLSGQPDRMHRGGGIGALPAQGNVQTLGCEQPMRLGDNQARA